MIWKGKRLKTFGDIMDAVIACGSPEEAQEFMRLYRSENPHADDNVGYGSGYYDRATMQRIQEWCCVAHPVFGRTIPTPQEAFDLGRAKAEGWRGAAVSERKDD